MTSIRRPFVRLAFWACVMIGIIAVAAVAGLHWWVIAVAAIAWAFITAADRGLERRLAPAGSPVEAEPETESAEASDQLRVVTALVAGALPPDATGAAVEEAEVAAAVTSEAPAEAEELVSVSAIVAAPPRGSVPPAEPAPAEPAKQPPVTPEPTEPEPVPVVAAATVVPVEPEVPVRIAPPPPAAAAPPQPAPEPLPAPPSAPVSPPPPPAAPEPPPAPPAPPLSPAPPPAAPEPPPTPPLPEPPQPPPPLERPALAPVGFEQARRWSIWTLDRLARETRNEELTSSSTHSRNTRTRRTAADRFDSLVRESFGEILGPRPVEGYCLAQREAALASSLWSPPPSRSP